MLSTPSKDTIGGWVRALRDARGISLERLAARAGLSKRTLAYWEAGAYQPRLPELEAALAALNASPTERALALSLVQAPRAARERRKDASVSALERSLGAAPSGGDLLRALRRRGRWTLEKASRVSGITAATLSRWESGKIMPPPEGLNRLLSALGVREPDRVGIAVTGTTLVPSLAEMAPSADALREGFRAFHDLLYHEMEDAVSELRFLAYAGQAWRMAAVSGAGVSLLAEIYADYSSYLAAYQRFKEAEEYANRALDLIPNPGPEPLVLRATLVASQSAVYRSPRAAPRRGIESLRMWQDADADAPYKAWLLADLAKYLVMEGETDGALALGIRAFQMANECENPSEAHMRRLDLGQIHLRSGRPEDALALVSVQPEDGPFWRAPTELLLAESHLAMGDAALAHGCLLRARADIAGFHLDHLESRAGALADALETDS